MAADNEAPRRKHFVISVDSLLLEYRLDVLLFIATIGRASKEFRFLARRVDDCDQLTAAPARLNHHEYRSETNHQSQPVDQIDLQGTPNHQCSKEHNPD